VPKTREGIYKEMLCVGKEAVAQFARDVFTDIAALFPGPFIHIGGDEIVTQRWEASPHVKSFAGMSGLGNLGVDIVEAWFCFVGTFLKSLNRTPIMWDDNFESRGWSVTRKCPGAEKDWIV
jgi:hexosaminidase